jgi:Luciferase-like monooxygenase
LAPHSKWLETEVRMRNAGAASTSSTMHRMLPRLDDASDAPEMRNWLQPRGHKIVFQIRMATRAFRFALLVERFSSHEALMRTTRQAEAAGFSTLLIRDHFTEEPFGHQFAPLVTLGVAAQATTTLRVGTLVIDNDYRHPAIARQGSRHAQRVI